MEETTLKEAIKKVYDVLDDIFTFLRFKKTKVEFWDIYDRFETAVNNNDKKSLNAITDEIYMTYQKRPLLVPFEILDGLPNIDFEEY